MPNQLSLTIGPNTVTVAIKPSISNAKLNAAILRYALRKGLPTEGRTATQIGESVLRSLLRHVADASIDQQRAELLALEQATREGVIAVDNDLVDPEIPGG